MTLQVGWLRGCATALVTPFTNEGVVDEKRLLDLVEYQIAGGVRLLVPCGTTGESATMSDEEDQFGNRRTILGSAKPGLTIRLNAGAYHIVSLYGDANATVRADVTVEPGKVTEATVKHAAAAITFKLVEEAGGEALAVEHAGTVAIRTARL